MLTLMKMIGMQCVRGVRLRLGKRRGIYSELG